jgi:hypothetical protein
MSRRPSGPRVGCWLLINIDPDPEGPVTKSGREIMETLLWFVKAECGVECLEEFSGDVALEAASDFWDGLALRAALADAVPGAGTVDHAAVGDGVYRSVQSTVAAAGEPPACDLTATGGDGVNTGQARVSSFAAAAAWVGVGDDGLSGTDRPDAAAGQQVGRNVTDGGCEFALVGCQGSVGVDDGLGQTLDLGSADDTVAPIGGLYGLCADGVQPSTVQRASSQIPVGVAA